MKNKKNVIIIASLAIMGVLGLVAVNSANAYQGNPNVKGPNYTIERHDAIEKAFDSKDYTAWKNLMQNRGRVTQIVNKDNFAKFAEAHNLAEQGKLTEAATIRKELGLGLKNGSGFGSMGGRGVGFRNVNR